MSTTFKPTFLYIKQHAVTGKLYFGKTVLNPEKYYGSGEYWKKHIHKHGREHVTNLWYCLFLDEESLVEFATAFSLQQSIVESTDWANLVLETGREGGSTPGIGNGVFGKKFPNRPPVSEYTRRLHSINMKRRMLERGPVPLTEEQRQALSRAIKAQYAAGTRENPTKGKFGKDSPNFGKKHSEESKRIRSEKMSGNNNHRYGKTVNEEVKQKWKDNGRGIGENNGNFGKTGALNHNYGKKRDPEMIERGAAKRRGRPVQQTTCPHCGKEGAISLMKRWHFDHCKVNQEAPLTQTHCAPPPAVP